MVMWHILHPGLPKKLGFVATFLCPDQERWKHLSGAKPAFYNATDADVEWRCVDECERQLKAAGRWHVYEQQIMAVKKPLSFMSKMGMPVDPEKRLDAAHRLEQLLDSNFTAVQQATKDSTARKRERKKPRQVPKGGEMTTEIVLKEVWQCDTCGLYGFAKSKHTKKVCGMGSKPEIVKVVASVDVPVLIHPFNANSPKQIVDYCREHKYDVPMKRDKDGNFKPTTDEKAIKILRAKYPDDPLFPHILHKRKLEKLAGTYIGRLEWNLEDGTVKVVGGMPMDKNYLVHTNYNDNPSTGRLGSNDPNMQNLPNPNRI
jgi:DNA polymerase I-like protein with 3'-5' exonuclease and polymerase domains